MEENTYKKVFHYIQQSLKPISPHELSRVTGKSRVSIHTALKRLMENGDIEKHGVSPLVVYTLKGVTKVIPTDLTMDDIARIIGPILKKYPIIYAGILGSFPDNVAKAGSIINMMISYGQPFSIMSLPTLEKALTEALSMQVDLITDQGANKYIKASMMNNLKIVYGTM